MFPQVNIILNSYLFVKIKKNKTKILYKLGLRGMISITDPDHIEVSNLNRQFLFREKHLRKPKSVTAAAVA